MKKTYYALFLLLFSVATSLNVFAAKDRYPNAITAFTGGATYCQGATANNLSVTYNNAVCGTTGGTGNTAITVTWYSNTTNSTTGGTVVSTVASTTGTTTFTYTPLTTTIGTLYYYCIITWTTGSGAGCTGGGSLSTASFTTQTQTVVVSSPMTYSSSAVAQYTPMNIDLNCTDVTNPILVFTVTVAGGCSADSITQFNFTTAGSTNAGTDITKARLYYTRQTAGYNAFYFFGSVNNPNGAFTINGSQPLLDGAGTYYFYLCYDISSSANSGDGVDATMNSFVFGGTTENNMSPNPICTGTIGNSACSGTPDLSGPTANLQTVPAGSYVIPMDNSHQNLWLTYAFNTKAYGLVRALLMQDIPVKWVIKTGKIKDSSDFSAVAARIYPTAVAASLQYFKASEFIIDTTYLNKSVYPGEETAIQVMSAFATEWKVAVYKLSSNTTVDVRYTLDHRPKIALFNNGTFQAVQLAMLDSAKVWTSGTDTALSAGAFDGLASCFTFCSEAHWSTGSQATDSATMAPVWQFVGEGGNFLAQCAGIDKYENQMQPNRHFESSRGVSDQNVTKTNYYHSPDMAFSQFDGTVVSRSGTVASFELPTAVIAHPSVWRPETYKTVSFSNTSGTTDTIVAAGIHLNNPDSTGGNAFYLAGHDYQTNTTTGDEIGTLDWINGARMYLNASLIPANRPTPTPLQAGSNATICEGGSVTLGGSPTGPTSGGGNTYTWSPSTGLNNVNSANPIASPTVTTTYTVFLSSNGCSYTPASVTVTVIPTPATPTASSNSPVCAGSTLNLTASTVTGATYSWSGPSSFSSTLQNPSISSVNAGAAGTYSVTATISGCPGIAGTTTVVVNPIPSSPTASSNTPVCAGSTLNLTASTVAGATYSWTGPNSFTSTSQNPSIAAATTLATGTYSVTASVGGCSSSAGTTTVTVNPIPTAPTAGSNGPICAGATLNLTASTIAGATYSWTGPNSFSSTLQNPSIAAATTLASGTYSVTATVSGCTSSAGTVTVTVNPIPAAPTASSNSPLCAGATLNLTSSTVAGATYAWTGPNTFSSAIQDPSIAAATTLASGTYSVTVTVSGCTSNAGTTNVTVNPIPTTPTVSSNSPICAGSTLTLTASTVAGATYAWTGPNTFSSTLQNPSIAAATTLATGTYSVVATVSGCGSVAGTTSVTVNPTPSAPTASSNSPICAGSALNLTSSTVAGATYAWTGPNTFSSALQDPSIAAATTLASGTYSVTVTVSGCTSTAGTTSVTVNPIPAAPTASSNSPICAGSTLNLTSSTVAGATYAWTGPNTFSSTLQNPSIAAATTLATGTYSVTVTVSGCTSGDATTSVTVNPIPTAPTASSNSPVCAGSPLTLSASTVAGAAYSWTGPASFSSSLQNPTIASATTAESGTYSVTVTVSGCPSAAATTSVTVNPIPNAPTASSNSPICAGSTLNLTASNVAGATYSWAGPNTFSSTLQNPSIAAATTAASGTYSVTAIVNGCPSIAATTNVTVNPIPTAPTASSNSPVCTGTALNLTASTVAGATYSWTGPNTFSSSSQNPTIASATLAAAGTYSVVATVSGCGSAAATTTVTVNPTPAAPTAGSNTPICAGSTLNLTSSTVAGATYLWAGPNSFSSSSQNPSIAAATTAASGTYSVTVTVNGCTSANGTTVVVVNPIPSSPTLSSNSPVCSGQTLNLTASTIAGATYAWTGPNTFSSALQNPSIAGVTVAATGIYSVTVTVSGCGNASATTSVTINPTPAAPTASSNSPICAGSTLTLSSSTVAGATYAWTGPNTFSSATQNPSIAAATVAASGTYSVTVTVSGCTSTAGTTAVTVNHIPAAPAASNNSPICEGTTLNLTSSTVAGATYSWTGPSSFSSALQNPSIAGVTIAADGTYSVTVTVSGCTSSDATTTVSITPTPATPIVSSNSPLCSGNTLNLTASTVAGATYSWTGPNTFSSSAQNPSIASATTATSGTYSVTVTVSGCASVAGTTSVTVNQTPAAPTASSNSPVCIGNTLNLTTGVVAGATYSWTGPNTFSSASQNPSIVGVTAAAAGTYTLDVTVAGCTSPTSTVTVVIGTPPTVTAGGNQTLCANKDTVILSGTSTTGSGKWTTSGTGTFSPSSTSLATTYIPSAADISAGTVTLTLTSTNNKGCVAATDQAVITITPAPKVNAGPNQTLCANNDNVSLNGTVTVASGGAWSTLGTGTFTPNNTTLNATYVPSNADTTAGKVTLVLTSTGNGQCFAVTDTMVVTFTHAPNVNAGSNVSVCKNNANVSLNGTSSTGKGTWTSSGTGTFTPNNTTLNATYVPSTADTATGSVTLTLTTGNNGTCTAVNTTITITFTPIPKANAGTNVTVCANNDSVSLSGSSTTGFGKWTSSGTGTFSPNDSALNATYVPSNADTTAGSVTLTLTTTHNGGCSSVNNGFTITFTHAPTANAGPDASACSNNGDISLNGVISNASGGVWSTSGTGTFSPNNTTLNAIYIPSSADTAAKVVILTLTTTGNGQCKAVSDTMKIIYTQSPKVEAGNNVKVCLSSPDYTLSGTSTTGSGKWTTSGTGTFTPSNTKLNATYVPSTADTTAGSVTLVLTSTANGGCNPVTDTVVITYTRTPTASAGTNQTVCANNDAVTLSGNSSTGTGIWTSSGTGTFTPNNTTLNATYTPSNADTTTGSITLTFTATGGCNPTAKSITITITHAPYVNAGANQFVCKSSPDASLNGQVSGGASTGIWTSSGTGTFSPSNTTLNAIYTPSTADTAAGKVTLVLTSTGNGNCLAVSDTMVIHYTLPPKALTGGNQSGCANNNISLSGKVIGGGGTGIWTTPNGTGSFVPNNSTLSASYVPSNADTAASPVMIILTSTNNGGCSAAKDTMYIIVHPNPVVNAGSSQTVCKNNGDITLSGSVKNVSGGKWSTTGTGTFSPNDSALNATYIPSSADTTAGTVDIILTSSGNGQCVAVSDTMIVTFSPSPTVNAGNNVTVCKNNGDVTLIGTSSTGNGIWNTSGTGTFSPNDSTLNATYIPSGADTGSGSVTITLSTTHNATCNAVSNSIIITFSPSPKVNAGPGQTVCANNDSIVLSGASSTGSGQWSTSGGGTFSPNNTTLNATYVPSNTDTTAKTVTLVLTSTNNASCLPVSDSMVVNFTPAPTANAGIDQTVCANNAAVSLNGLFTVSSGAMWSTTGSGTFSPNNTTMAATYTPSSADTAAHSIDIILTTTGNGQCKEVSDTMVVTITPAPNVEAGSDALACLSSPNYALNGSSSTGSGTWSTLGTGTFTPNNNSLNATYVPSTADTTARTVTLILTSSNNGTCNAVTDTMVINYANPPTVNAGSNQTVCANNDSVMLNGNSSTGSGTWSSSGTGTFAPNNTTANATYVPSSADTAAHSIILTYTTVGGCTPVSQSITITITPAPFVNAGPDAFACKTSPDVNLNGVVGGGTTTGIWTTSGSGTFSPGNTALNATYIPSTADTTAGSVTLILTSTGNGNCLAASDTMIIHYIATPHADAGADVTACTGNSVPLNGVITGGAGTGIWTTPNGGGTFAPNNTTLTASYIPSESDTTVKNVILILTSTNNGTCLASSDTMIITVNPGPIVNAGPNQSVCKNNGDVTLNGNVKVATGGKWTSSGTGTFMPNDSTLNATYVPSSADTAAGKDTLVLTSTGNGICQQVTDTMIVTFTPAPLVNAGSHIFVCTGAGMSVNLNGTVSGGATTGIWTTLGSGTFSPNDSALNATYTLSTADTTAKTVKLVLTSTGNGTCNAVSDTVLVTVTSSTIVNAGKDTTVCSSSIVQLNGTVNGGTSTGIWSTSGNGTFSPNDSTLNATYTPGSADSLAGSVTLILTSTGSSLCKNSSDTMIATFRPAAIVNAGSNISICGGIMSATLNGSVTGGSTTGMWTTLGSGTFTPNDSALNATYNLSTADTTAKTVKLVLTSTHNGLCGSASDTVLIQVIPAPVVNAGNDTTICANDTAFVLRGKVSSGTAVWSTTGTGTFSPNDSALNATYKFTSADTATKTITFILTSTHSCAPVSDTMVMHFSPAPKANAGANQAICSGSSVTLSGLVSVSGGGMWSTAGSGTFEPNDSALSVTYVPGASDISSGNAVLVLTTTHNGGCLAVKDTIDISIQSKPVANFVSSKACLGSTITFTDSSKVSTGTITSWAWTFTNGTSAIQDPTDTFDAAGFHPVTLIVSTSAGCSDTITKSVYVNTLPVAAFGFTTFCPDSAEFTDGSTVTPGVIKAWNWAFGDSTSSSLQNPTHTYPGSGNYVVTLTVTSDSGCSASRFDTVKEIPCNAGGSTPPGVPTAFTPNGDGNNDVLYVMGGPFSQFDFRVFNEWGNEVFHGIVQSSGWDGTFHGKKQPEGTYIWTLNGVTIDGKDVKMTGDVTIIR